MPIDIASSIFFEGPQSVPGWEYIKNYGPPILAASAIKFYFGGSSNTFTRLLHGRVYMITGGTTGLGAVMAYELASKGAQVILLTRSTDDAWTVEFIEDLRDKTDNFMVYAEYCDLSSLHSIRLFATKWLDNSPPRRLDGVICCASECIPKGRPRQTSVDGIEAQLAVNYFAHYHLLTLLKPAFHVQPPDRDIRIVLTTCSTQAAGQVEKDDLLWEKRKYLVLKPWQLFGTSKLLLGMFGRLFQRKLVEYERKDKSPCNVKVSIVNPGIMRSSSTRRYFSMGTVWGLLIYVILYPIWFLFFKSPVQGAQSLLFAILAPMLGANDGGNIIQECKIAKSGKSEYADYVLQDQVYEETAKIIERLEKLSAIERKKQEKKTGADKKRKKAEQEKMEDLQEKPKTDEELQYKINMIRKSMGISTSKDEMPLFPEGDVSAAKENVATEPVKRGKRNKGKGNKKN